MRKKLIVFSVITLIAACSSAVTYAAPPATKPNGKTSGYKIMANNDLGMHCVCPTFDFVMVLPPFNTFRAQAFLKGSQEPSLISDTSRYRVAYSILENTDSILKADPRYQNWMKNSPKLFPGFNPVNSAGNIQGLTGATLSGDMQLGPGSTAWWEVKGVPAFPVVTGTSTDIMIDPLGGPNRTPYLTGQVQLIDKTTNKVLATDQFTVPVANGGCCGCHLQLAQSYGYANPTPLDSFKVMGKLHGQNSSGIDISMLDVDGDGVPGPVRCSWCHVDPAMGETIAPGVPAGYKILPGATFTSSAVKTSKYTFSDVLHRFHSQDSVVLSSYDPNIAKNCYDCHPGNGVNCYRDTHTTKTINGHQIWCTDCHGDLNYRVATHSMDQPWSDKTLPKCSNCHGTSYGEGDGWLNLGIFGSFLNSSGHHDNKVLCSTCHGSPHGLNPSTLAKDNQQNINLQNDPRALGNCSVCHGDQGSTWRVPPH